MKQLRSTFLRAVAAHRALRPYGMPHRRQLVRGAGATLVLVAARLSFPWPLRGLLEIVFHNNGTGGPGEVIRLVPHRGDPAVWLIGAFVVIILVWGIAEARQRLAFTRYAVGLSRGLRDATLANLPAPRRSRGAGEVISTVTGDIARIIVGVKGILIGVSRNGAFFIGVTVIVTIIDPLVGLVFLTGGVATVVAGAIGASRSSVIIRRSRKREGVLADDLHHYLAGDANAVAPTAGSASPADSKATRVEGLTTFIVHAILAASTCGILIVTIHDGRNGRLSPGAVFTILAYILLMHNKTVGLGRGVIRAGRVLPSAERIAAMLARHPKARARRAKSAPVPSTDLSDPGVASDLQPRPAETRTEAQ